jgi:hypothetical protein
MKINIPPNVTLSPAEIEQWKAEVSKMTEDFWRNAPAPKADFEIELYRQVKGSTDITPFITPMWWEHYEHAEEQFLLKNPELLQDNLMQYAIFLSMGGVLQRKQMPFLESVRPEEELRRLLAEDPWLKPNITHAGYQSSENLINHLTHLVSFEEKTGCQIKNLGRIVEFGGGYGGFARLCRRMSPGSTHIIIDLPVFLCIQAYFLKNVFGPEAVHILTDANARIEPGKINLVAIGSDHVDQIASEHNDLFVATWSLSEANQHTQDYVFSRDYFRARHLLFGYRHYEHINPRQPCSDSLRETANYSVVYRGEAFWSPLNHYFFCKAK